MTAKFIDFETKKTTEIHPYVRDFTIKINGDICRTLNDNLTLFHPLAPEGVDPGLFVSAILSVLSKRLVTCMLDITEDAEEAKTMLYRHIDAQLAHVKHCRTN